MQLSSRILTALAVLILAVAVVAVRAGSPGTVQAATGDISVLNVGTCYTTNTDAFGVGDCKDGQLDDTDDDGDLDTDVYNVADRDSITKVDTVYATYAIDPKTSGDQPRAIAKNADLIKISIEDKGRDKRSGVLYAVGTTADTVLAESAAQTALKGTLKDLVGDLKMAVGPDLMSGTIDDLIVVTGEADFADTGAAPITASGLYTFRLAGVGSTEHPMAPKDDGRRFLVRHCGCHQVESRRIQGFDRRVH